MPTPFYWYRREKASFRDEVGPTPPHLVSYFLWLGAEQEEAGPVFCSPGQFSGDTCHVDVPHLLVESGGYILNGWECPVRGMLAIQSFSQQQRLCWGFYPMLLPRWQQNEW